MTQPGRNDACPCGSGKKYKHCCALKQAPAASAPPALAALLQAGLAHHQAGRLAQAEPFYQQILQRDPKHAEALHLLGVLAYQVRQYDTAAQLISRAIEVNPLKSEYHVNLGTVRQDQGQLTAALEHYRQALALKPDSAEAHNNLGNVLLNLDQAESAAASYRAALRYRPEYPEAHNNLGNALQAMGQLGEAITCFERALSYRPDYAEAHNNLGNLLQSQKLLDQAIARYRHALGLQPGFVKAHLNLGNALQERGELLAAIDSYRAALALAPSFAEAHNNLGNALQALGRSAEAMEHYEQAIALKADYPQAHYNLGIVLQGQLQSARAAEHYRRAVELKPDYAEAHYNLGIALEDLGQIDEAAHGYHRALTLKPDYAEAYTNFGRWLTGQGRLEEAIEACQRALHYQPHSAEALNNWGVALQELGRLDEAIDRYQLALAVQPDYAITHNNLGKELSSQGKFDAALNSFRRALQLKPEFDVAHSNVLFHLNYAAQQSAEQYLAEARAFGAKVAARAEPYFQWPAASATGRLRIGFVSGDLRDHPVGFFLESVVAHLDPARFELVAYVTKPGEDALTARLKPYFAQWHSLLGLKDREAARRIHDDGIQILVDLAGHTADNRLPVFAWKPAPVQVAWLGYFASTGVKEIDYIIADPQVLPESEESHFSETPWRLPDCYLCFTPPHHQIEVGALPALANGYVTFGCFNKLSKMNDAVVALWARVLHAVPDARLLLKAKELTDVSAQTLTRARFAAHGIAPERILLEAYSSRAAYFEQYHRVDIALDPFPYPGGTTTVEALWMGVPVLSRRGARFLSHAGESLLQTAGLADWLAQGDDDYVARAQRFSSDLLALAALRARLRAQLSSSPLCDAPRFAANLGAAFAGMWQRYLERAMSMPPV